jgi:uncharacterized protein (DUF2126 family)
MGNIMIKLCSVENDSVVIELRVALSGSMREAQERIQATLNEAGVMLSRKALKRFDTDGSPIRTGAIKWSTKAPPAASLRSW